MLAIVVFRILRFVAAFGLALCGVVTLDQNFLRSERLHLLDGSLGLRKGLRPNCRFIPIIEMVLDFDFRFAADRTAVVGFRIDERERYLGHAGWLAVAG